MFSRQIAILAACCLPAIAQTPYTFLNPAWAGAIGNSAAFSYLGAVQADGPNHLWVFGGTQVQDVVGSATVAAPASLITNQAPIMFKGLTAAVVTNTTVDVGSSNINNFASSNNFSYEILLVSSNTAAGVNSHYALVSNQQPNGGTNGAGYEIALNYNPQSKFVNGTICPNTFMTVSLTFADGSQQAPFSAALNVTQGSTNLIDVVYTNILITGPGNCSIYLNGNYIQTTVQGTPPFGITTSTNDLLFLNRTTGTTNNFAGIIQSIASYTNALTDTQILNHYLASIGQGYSPNNNLYSAIREFDGGAGGFCQRLTGCYVYDTNASRYSIFGQAFSNDVSVCSGQYDSTNANKIGLVISTNLAHGSFTNMGVVFDCSGIANIWSAERPSVVWNPNTGKWVMWVHQRNNTGGGPCSTSGYYAIVGESATLNGPYTMVTNTMTLDPNLDHPGDLTIFTDSNSNGYCAYALQTTNWVIRLDPAFHYTTNNPVAFNIGNNEAPNVFQHGGVWYAMSSLSEYYNASQATNIFYSVANNPMGPWMYQGSVFYDWSVLPGSGYDGQGACWPFPLMSSTNGTYVFAVDNWHTGSLTNSPVVYYGINWINSGQNVPPLPIAMPLKSIPMTGLTNTIPVADVTSGLQNRYLFNGNLNDSQGSANLTGTGSPTFTSNQTGTANTAVSFNGSSQYASSASAFNLSSASQAYTISGWYKENAANSLFGRSLSYETGGGVGPNMQWGSTNNFTMTFKNRSHLVAVPYSAFLYGNSSNWNMITATWDGSSTFSVYVNGQLYGVAGGADTGTAGTTLGIGVGTAFFTQFWPGSVSRVSIYNRAISGNEVLQLYRFEE